ncbi:Eco57I restriction-modification methylase domain-containing protein [Methanobrevibacter sp.]|uniref:Eco57I restriction-modification methylase domain-containing protein n=1 Tax=Methanobrevibacter sp. TaxID=66852 RepID=UPI003865C3C2
MSEAKIENNLFNDKKMEEFIHTYDDLLVVNSEKDPVNDWISKLDNDELRSEKANYLRFFRIILEDILGYELTDIEYEENIGDEGRPVEFTLKKEDKDYVVVELKGTSCKDLNKRYNREQSPIEQVTNYASIKEETKWAFVSNYNEFRLFNPSYREKYISFKFKQLTDPNILKKFLLIFSKFSLIEKDIPQTLLKETRIIERELEDEFYKLFSETRLMLMKELEHSSEFMGRIEAIRLSQLILNRFIFLCFAEDLKLIPSETTADVLLTPIKHKNLFEFTMWDRLNELFRFADKGNSERGIGAFNGGLFKESLRHLEIRDKIDDLGFFDDCFKTWKFEEKYEEIESLLGVYKDTLNPIYKNLLLISSFDFGSELSVNILGHIFENSIGDIEELKEENTQRRKKDGVYYTPEYITDYICRNTIISHLSITGNSKTIHELISEYEEKNKLDELDIKLKDIKIVDPACGSGAFLNKAVDVLFEIHEALHNSKYAGDESLNRYFDSLDSRRQIISNNIYGVDLNEESVEITKLSLFLKLATSTGVMQGFKLPNLDRNIKCGNSIISDMDITIKSFDWKNEFKEVFDNGGFDIVVGNPPYGAKLDKIEQKYLNKKYIKGGSETAISFIKLAYDYLLKDNGKLGYIVPKSFTFASNYAPIREHIFSNIDIMIDCKKVWKEVKLEQVIFTVDKSQDYLSYNNGVILDESIKIISKLPKSSYDNFKILLNGITNEELTIANQIYSSERFLNDIVHNSRGGVFQKEISTEGDSFVLGGSEIQRNGVVGIKGKINKSLVEHEDKNIIKENAVLVQRLVSHILKPVDHIKITACIPEDINYFIVDTINQLTVTDDNITKFYVWALLNSKLINWYCYRFIYSKAIRTMQFDNPVTSKIPIPKENNDLVNNITIQAKELFECYLKVNKIKDKFFNRMNNHFEGIKINKTLTNYETLDFKKFNNQLQKQKFKLSLFKEEEWEDYFMYSKEACLEVISEIELLEKKINDLIYESYGLTSEEINIIENSFKK